MIVQNPDIFKKAQAIVDAAIVDLDRLPDFAEYQSIPYIDALVREVLRYRPVTPICSSSPPHGTDSQC